MIKYNALNIIKTNNKSFCKISSNYLDLNKVKKNYIVIKVIYSNINFKDKLLSSGNSGLIRKYPHVPGIDAAGKVFYTKSKSFKKGDYVFAIGQPLGVEMNGGMAQFVTLPANWATKIDKNDIKKAISYGTSGFTAMLAFINLLKESKKISKKKLLIAGGTTGVGYFLLLILKNANYNVDVITGNKKNFVRLKSLGASKIYTYNEIFKLYNQPFIKKKYDIVFDNVGGDFFGLFLKILNKNGLYFSIGNIKGNIANINILQFILNKIKVIGINLEDQKKNFKLNIFKKLKKIIKENDTKKFIKIVSLNFANKLMNGFSKKNYKYVIKIN